MARRSPPKNELQDPAQPHKRRARWRVIGAFVLACCAIVVLPLALESEPKQTLSHVDVQIPKRASLDEGRPWMDSRATDLPPSDAPVSAEARPGAVARVDVQTPEPRTLPVPEREASAKSDGTGRATDDANAGETAGKGEADDDARRSAAALAAANAAAEAAKVKLAEASKSNSANEEAARKASERSAQKTAKASPPPMPERRKDRNALKAASPSGYVVQIGAFSSNKGARTQMARARKLGFEAYTESITTKKGERIRVRVGPYLTRQQANVARAKLRAEGIDTVLIAP